MHLRCLVFVLLTFPAGARRRMLMDDSQRGAQQQSNTLTNELEVSVESQETLIPGSSLARSAGQQMPELRWQSASRGASKPIDNLGDYDVVSQPQRSATPVMQFGGNFFKSADEKMPAKKNRVAKTKLKKFQKSEKAAVRGPASLAVLGAPLAGLPAILLAASLANPAIIPDKTPFAFLDGFYPPAVERAAQVKAINEKNAAIEKEKAEAEKKKNAEKKKAEEEAEGAAGAASAKTATKDAGAKKPTTAVPRPAVPRPEIKPAADTSAAIRKAAAEKAEANKAAQAQISAAEKERLKAMDIRRNEPVSPLGLRLRRTLGPIGYGTRSSLEADGGSIYALPGGGGAAGDSTVGKAKGPTRDVALESKKASEARIEVEAKRKAANLQQAKEAGEARQARIEEARAERKPTLAPVERKSANLQQAKEAEQARQARIQKAQAERR